MHMVFTGPPGVGKTQVASAMGAILRSLKVLRSGHLIAVTRSDLVAGYVGQTAIKTMEKCREALDGILFIDEAYSWSKSAGSGPDFGKEAITTFMKFMDDNRDRMIVIVAGYPDHMRRFIDAIRVLPAASRNISISRHTAPRTCAGFYATWPRNKASRCPQTSNPRLRPGSKRIRVSKVGLTRAAFAIFFERSREAQAMRLVTSKGAGVSQIEMVDIERAMEVRR